VHEDENLAMLIGVERRYVAVERFAARPLSAVVAVVGREPGDMTERRSWWMRGGLGIGS
jgi:hypothetical protein